MKRQHFINAVDQTNIPHYLMLLFLDEHGGDEGLTTSGVEIHNRVPSQGLVEYLDLNIQ
jgi:hypothetical protein